MLIDSFAPDPDAVEAHSIAIKASTEQVLSALWATDLGGHVIIKLLLGLRALPGLVLHGSRSLTRNRSITLKNIIESGFGILADGPDEIVLGVAGKFWRPTGNLLPFNRESFEGAVPPGLARAVWNFSLKQSQAGETILSTETRVVCGDLESRRKFRVYWFFVRPFSGLIRLIMLRAVKQVCSNTNM